MANTENYIMLNGKRVDLTDEQLKALGLYEEPKKSPFDRVENSEHYYVITPRGTVCSEREGDWEEDREHYNVANYCTDEKLMNQRALHETLNRLLWRFSMKNDGNEIELEPKIQRQVFGYNDEVLAQLRLYPQSNDSGAKKVYDDIRAIVQKVIADCLDKPNMWIKSKNDTNSVIKKGIGATCYPDWSGGNPGAQHCSISTLKERENGKDGRRIIFGAKPICVKCGSEHNVCESISCCEYGNYEYCECCGERVYRDDQYWCYNDCCYCRDCVEYCDECNEWIPKDEINEIDGKHVCDDCIDNSDNYERCENCGEVHHCDNMTNTEDGYCYCSECENDYTFICEKCGWTFDKENGNYDEQTGELYCEDCYDKLIEEREDELEEVI